MNYIKQYEQLVTTRLDRLLKEGEYYVKHNILPKSLGGTNEASNLVVLTAREHYIAHWLLTKIYRDNWKLHYAFYQMSKCTNTNNRIISSKQFERARRYLSSGAKLRHRDPNYINPGKGEKSRTIASMRMSGDKNPMRGRPEKNNHARPHTVIFNDGTTKTYLYGKLGYEELGISRSTWILATRTGISIPKFDIKQIIKH